MDRFHIMVHLGKAIDEVRAQEDKGFEKERPGYYFDENPLWLLLMNWSQAKKQFSSGIVEGFNTKVKLTTRKAYGFRTFHATEIALYHTQGRTTCI